MSGTAGTVAVVNGTAPLTCSDSAACQAASVDLVGYGTAAINEAAPAAGASNTDSVQRKDAADSDNNAGDFAAGAPTPGATNVGGDGGGTGDGDPGPLRIHDIQDSSWLAAHNGEQVTNVPGIVTGIRTSGQQPRLLDPGPRSRLERGHQRGHLRLHVVARGGGRRLGARVRHRPRLLSAVERRLRRHTSNLSVTEIGTPTVIVRSHGNALPAPEVIGPGTVPDAYAPDLNGANIESTPITPSRSALDFWESREGMRVEVDDASVVGPSNSFGEQFITTKPAQATTYRGGTEILAENAIPSGRVEVVPANGANPGVDVGDVTASPEGPRLLREPPPRAAGAPSSTNTGPGTIVSAPRRFSGSAIRPQEGCTRRQAGAWLRRRAPRPRPHGHSSHAIGGVLSLIRTFDGTPAAAARAFPSALRPLRLELPRPPLSSPVSHPAPRP